MIATTSYGPTTPASTFSPPTTAPHNIGFALLFRRHCQPTPQRSRHRPSRQLRNSRHRRGPYSPHPRCRHRPPSRGVFANTDLTITGPPALPEAPRLAYVLRRRPDTDGNPLHDLAIHQIRTSFTPTSERPNDERAAGPVRSIRSRTPTWQMEGRSRRPVHGPQPGQLSWQQALADLATHREEDPSKIQIQRQVARLRQVATIGHAHGGCSCSFTFITTTTKRRARQATQNGSAPPSPLSCPRSKKTASKLSGLGSTLLAMIFSSSSKPTTTERSWRDFDRLSRQGRRPSAPSETSRRRFKRQCHRTEAVPHQHRSSAKVSTRKRQGDPEAAEVLGRQRRLPALALTPHFPHRQRAGPRLVTHRSGPRTVLLVEVNTGRC